jgi:hypothetical protein
MIRRVIGFKRQLIGLKVPSNMSQGSDWVIVRDRPQDGNLKEGKEDDGRAGRDGGQRWKESCKLDNCWRNDSGWNYCYIEVQASQSSTTWFCIRIINARVPEVCDVPRRSERVQNKV